MNLYNMCILLGAALVIIIVLLAKTWFYPLSSGDYSSVERKGAQFAHRISSSEYERQKRDFTMNEVNKLTRSSLYQMKMKDLRMGQDSRESLDYRSTQNRSSIGLFNYR